MTQKGMRILLAGTAAWVSMTAAQAQTAPGPAGTAADTVIENTAQASYTVNGVQQSTTSNTARFRVDRKVNLTVTPAQPGNTQVSVGQPNASVAFRVTNNTNATQDFLLSSSQTPVAGLFAGDNFDVSNIRIFVDSNGNGTYEAGVDTATFINELGADQSAVVLVVADVPAQQSAVLAGITLIATAAAGGDANAQGAALQPSLGLNDDNVVDIVFADNDSDGVGLDTAYNGQNRAALAYEIGTRNVALTVSKSSLVLNDGVSLINPKALPGATVQYCLVVNNATLLTAASNIALTDIIPANTTYVANSIAVGAIPLGSTCLLSGIVGGVPLADDGSVTVPLLGYTGSYNATTKTVNAGVPTLLGGTSVAATFRVTIN